MKKTILLLSVLIIIFGCKKQSDTIIKISVIDGDSNSPVKDVAVTIGYMDRITSLDNSKKIYTKISDNNGNAEFIINDNDYGYYLCYCIKGCQNGNTGYLDFGKDGLGLPSYPKIESNSTNSFKCYIYNMGYVKLNNNLKDYWCFEISNKYGDGLISNEELDVVQIRSGENDLEFYFYESNHDFSNTFDADTVLTREVNVVACDTIIVNIPK
jgi:hypothetical protein